MMRKGLPGLKMVHLSQLPFSFLCLFDSDAHWQCQRKLSQLDAIWTVWTDQTLRSEPTLQ